MSNKQNTPKPNSYKTVITDPAGNPLAEWVSTTPRTEAERREIGQDLGAVLLAYAEGD